MGSELVRAARESELLAGDFMTNDGRECRHDMLGFYLCTQEEAEHEDAGNPSVGFDMRAHFDTAKEAIDVANAGRV